MLGMLSVLFVAILFFLQISKTTNQSIERLTSLTKLPGIALSRGYLQNRVLYYQDYSYKLYPQMKDYSKSGFVYAK